MSGLIPIAFASALIVSLGQATQPQTLSSRDVLDQALSRFDSATAIKAKDSNEARRLYREALEGFDSLIHSGVSNGRLHFNIANTHMAMDQLGPAIAHYRLAQRLLPGDASIEHNLQTARRLVQVSFNRPTTSAVIETLFFWHFTTAQTTRLRVAVICYAIFWLLMLARIKRSRNPFLAWTAALAAVMATAAGSSVAWQQLSERNHPEGVIIASEATLRKGNGDYYDPLLAKPLPEGVEFRVRSQRNDVHGALWYQIQLPDAREGWFRADQVLLLDRLQA